MSDIQRQPTEFLTSFPVIQPVSRGRGDAGVVPVSPSEMPVVRTGKEPNGNVVLKAHQIRKSYRIGTDHRWVLNGVDFQVAAGECVFLCGPSGSGKSTLLSILGCLLRCDSGEITVAGCRIDQMTGDQATQLRRQQIGFVFQRFQLIRGLSAEDNVAVPLSLQGVSLSDARRRAGDLLKKVGLELYRRRLPTQMSPGQCQRVALARAVITSPRIVLADEPTAALDGKSGVEAMELLKELVAATGSATVVVTHDPRILGYADRVCEIENGQFK